MTNIAAILVVNDVQKGIVAAKNLKLPNPTEIHTVFPDPETDPNPQVRAINNKVLVKLMGNARGVLNGLNEITLIVKGDPTDFTVAGNSPVRSCFFWVPSNNNLPEDIIKKTDALYCQVADITDKIVPMQFSDDEKMDLCVIKDNEMAIGTIFSASVIVVEEIADGGEN